MKTIMVDDEIWMLQAFIDECASLSQIELVGKFTNPLEALAFSKENRVDLAFLDITMPQMDGLTLCDRLREIHPDIIVIFVSAYEEYMPDAFRTRNADYYVLKPYNRKDVENVLQRAVLLSSRLKKRTFIHTFGNFSVLVDNEPVRFTSPKAKEMLAILVDQHSLVDNHVLFSILYEDKPYDHTSSVAYHNVAKRLRMTLQEHNVEEILVVQKHAYGLNEELFDCDYYQLLRREPEAMQAYDGRYMSEYYWSEDTIANLYREFGK